MVIYCTQFDSNLEEESFECKSIVMCGKYRVEWKLRNLTPPQNVEKHKKYFVKTIKLEFSIMCINFFHEIFSKKS